MFHLSNLVLLLTVCQVSSTAVFELQLNQYRNFLGNTNEGNCCSGTPDRDGNCSEMCNTKFRVCLKVFQEVINYRTPCSFGEVFTPVLGANEINFEPVEGFKNPVQFKIDSWQNTFSLIIEAWHDTNGTSSYDGVVENILVQRVMTQRWLDVDARWIVDDKRTEHSRLNYQYRVVCKNGYYGPACRVWCRPRHDNFGHYVCDQDTGRLLCMDGWKNDQNYCLDPICSEGCDMNHGKCDVPKECKCHIGWKGPNCDTCKVYPGCKNGTCTKEWECDCKESWGGLFCNQDLNYCANHKPCKNGATCFNDKPGSYSCRCPTGFRGTNCEVTNHTCATDPCQNGGTCLDTSNDSFVCQCPAGFSGQYCHISGKTCADRPCLNDAICRDTMSGFKCHCRAGFEGETCQIAVNECDSNPCLNGGSCVDEHDGFRCVCAVGFAGSECQTNIDDCSNRPCVNGGVCVDGVNSFKCKCPLGYAGILCESFVNFCVTTPCINGGVCSSTSNSFKCTCPAGFGGKFCEEGDKVSPCESSPCANGGQCTDSIELSKGYRCSCPPSHAGKDCTVPTVSEDAIEAKAQQAEKMASSQVVLIIVFSVAVPLVAVISAVVILCKKKRGLQLKTRDDDKARRQNEQNIIHHAVNNQCLESNMIFNSLDYPVKPVNTESQKYNQMAGAHYPKQYPGNGGKDFQQQLHQEPQYFDGKKAVENAYSIVPARSSKTLNTDASRHSLASKLEKDLDAVCSRRSSPVHDGSYCKTPDPMPSYSSHKPISVYSGCSSGDLGGCSIPPSHHHHNLPPDIYHHNSNNTSSASCSPSTVASSVYVIDEHYDDTYIATQV